MVLFLCRYNNSFGDLNTTVSEGALCSGGPLELYLNSLAVVMVENWRFHVLAFFFVAFLIYGSQCPEI